jgi:endonuclease/exonuclease/phosphatase (EEP) superfamily protein YafD
MIIDAPAPSSRPLPSRAPRSAPPAPAPPEVRGSRVLLWVACAYFVVLVADWLVMRQLGDRWWPATVLLIAPRWPLAVPLACLGGLAIWRRRWRLIPLLAASCAVLLFPILGLRVSPLSLGASRGELRLVTCNVHRQHLSVEALRGYIAAVQPDIVTLQGWSDTGHEGLFGEGWDVRREGEVLIASRLPIERVMPLAIADEARAPGEVDGAAALVEVRTSAGTVTLVSLHLASPHGGLLTVSGDSGGRLRENSERRWRESERLRQIVAGLNGPVLLAGDFNTTDDSPIFREHWGGFADAFSSCGWGFGYTYLNNHTQIRIDHVLVGSGAAAVSFGRGPDIGSPHRPLVVDVTIR